jgi:hypothetical protein
MYQKLGITLEKNKTTYNLWPNISEEKFVCAHALHCTSLKKKHLLLI